MLAHDLEAARQQQAATADILRTISRSRADLSAVLGIVAENAARLCDAFDSIIVLRDGGTLREVAHYGPIPSLGERQFPPGRGTVLGRAVIDGRVVHVEDLQTSAEFPEGRVLARELGHRGTLAAPLLREGTAIGALIIRRMEAHLFSDSQVALLQTFAEQAAIAIENTHMFEQLQARNRDLQESLEHQTATSKVLEVISRSAFDLQKVLDTLIESAAVLCGADIGTIRRRDGDDYRVAATFGFSPEARARIEHYSPQASRTSIFGQAVMADRTVHIPDILADPDYARPDVQQITGFRAALGVLLRREDSVIGVLVLQRLTPGPFTPRQIELVETFANQAVIAIENTRLFNETTEALDRQTAMGEILQVISTSPTDLGPVLQTIAETAARLCATDDAMIFRRSGDDLNAAAHWGPLPMLMAKLPVARGSVIGRAVFDRSALHIEDFTAVAADYPGAHALIAHGVKTMLAMPLLSKGEAIGVIGLRRLEKRPFTEPQIDLLRTFASQAVIAIENTRLFGELQARTRELTESLEYQTSTSEVLNVISRSPNALQPVFDVMLQTAGRLCEADYSLFFMLGADEKYHLAASNNATAEFVEHVARNPLTPTRGSLVGRCALERQIIHLPDCLADPEYHNADYQRVGQHRTVLGVPLLRDGVVIGVIGLPRNIVKPYTDRQIELVRTFADQAVIAIENTRLFEEVQARTRELTEALEYQTATSDVLNVISRSPNDLKPVLDVMLQTASRLCVAEYALFFKLEADGKYHIAGSNNAPAEYINHATQNPLAPGRGSLVGRTALERSTVHIPDCLADSDYESHGYQRIGQHRTMLGVPLLREGNPIGVIGLMRTIVQPYTTRQIELVRTFADQAVIAIENVRLFEEVQARTREVTEALEYQTATSEVLNVISRSPTDAQPVFGAIAESTARLCQARFCHVYRYDGEFIHFMASYGHTPEGRSAIERAYPVVPGRGSCAARAILTGTVEQVPDIEVDPDYTHGGVGDAMKIRSVVAVPMLKDGRPIGAIALLKAAVGHFPQRQIELLQTFADQAVIAINNVTLFEQVQARTREVTESLEYQTATSEVLNVISRSPRELTPVLDAMLKTAGRLCESEHAVLFRVGDDSNLHLAGSSNAAAEFVRYATEHPIPVTRASLAGRVTLERRTIHLPDVMADPEYTILDYQAVGRYRTSLGVPLLREGQPIGVIILMRNEVRPYTDRQIELVTTFADQAVIAINNVGLFEEVQARTAELAESLRQQTATADVLKVISRSAFDLKSVLQTLVESAAQLCDAEKVTITRQRNGKFYREEAYGFSAEFLDRVRGIPIEPETGSASGRALLEGRTVHITDVHSDPGYTFEDGLRLGGFRTILAVPMLRNGTPIGVLVLTREAVRPFSDKQIEMVSTFADQAAIAIENVRLFEHVEARTRDLARSLEELRSAQDRLVQTEKLASLGQLTAGIAHEIKNPLNFVNNFAALSIDLLGELQEIVDKVNLDAPVREEVDELSGMLRGNLDKVVQHGKRADSIVKNMLLHSREGSGERRSVGVNALVEESLNLAYHGARAEKPGFNITLQRALDPAAGDADLFPQEIVRVLLNLISNGFYAATKRKAAAGAAGPEPVLAVATRDLGDRVEIRVRDNGTGIPPEVRDRIFNPFFTTKPAGEGTGLGLSLSHDIVVKQHAGAIDVDTQPGEFTEFRIVLPRAAANASPGTSDSGRPRDVADSRR